MSNKSLIEVFNKDFYQFEISVKYNDKFKRYELLAMLGLHFYEFSNKNKVQEFARSFTHYVDEILTFCEMAIFKMNSLTSFLCPISLNKKLKEHTFLQNLFSASHYCNQLKLYKNKRVEFYQVINTILSIFIHLENSCVQFDKRFLSEISTIFELVRATHVKFLFNIRNYQKGVTNKDLRLIS